MLTLGQVTSQPGTGVTAVGGRGAVLLCGIGTMLGSALSNQGGAALGTHAFGALGPAGVVATRQVVAAVVLLPSPAHRRPRRVALAA